MRIALALALTGVVAVATTASAGVAASRGVPQGFRPETAAAVGAHHLWVLGQSGCAGNVPRARPLHRRRQALQSNRPTAPSVPGDRPVDRLRERPRRLRLRCGRDSALRDARRRPELAALRASPSRHGVRCGRRLRLRRVGPTRARAFAGRRRHVAESDARGLARAVLAGSSRIGRLVPRAASSSARLRHDGALVRSRPRVHAAEGSVSRRAGRNPRPRRRRSRLGRLPERDDGLARALQERRSFVPRHPVLPRSERASTAEPDQRRADRSGIRTRCRLDPRRRRRVLAHRRRGSSLERRAAIPRGSVESSGSPLRRTASGRQSYSSDDRTELWRTSDAGATWHSVPDSLTCVARIARRG